MTQLTRKVFFLFISMLVYIPGFSQPGDPTQDPDTVPIQGLGYLIAAGVLFGVRKMFEKNKINK
jgi:hypothetical protein